MKASTLTRKIMEFWKQGDKDFERKVSFDACDRERVSRELARHLLRKEKK